MPLGFEPGAFDFINLSFSDFSELVFYYGVYLEKSKGHETMKSAISPMN